MTYVILQCCWMWQVSQASIWLSSAVSSPASLVHPVSGEVGMGVECISNAACAAACAIPDGAAPGRYGHRAAPSGRRRGVRTCVALSVNNQFLASFLRSDLQDRNVLGTHALMFTETNKFFFAFQCPLTCVKQSGAPRISEYHIKGKLLNSLA